ncbi:hypothetical protein NKH18_21205 [Streptomyces sp. M10(2022)]
MRPDTRSRLLAGSQRRPPVIGNRQWIITAYAPAFASLLLLGGRLADLFGRKPAFSGHELVREAARPGCSSHPTGLQLAPEAAISRQAACLSSHAGSSAPSLAAPHPGPQENSHSYLLVAPQWGAWPRVRYGCVPLSKSMTWGCCRRASGHRLTADEGLTTAWSGATPDC